MIKLKNLNKSYKVGKEKHKVLKSINLNINKGEFLMIMGKSGSGKSTLLNILAFLDKFDDGQYLFNDKDVSFFNEKKRSKFRNENIGFVFQQFNLINALNIYSNVEMPMIYKKRINKKTRKEIVENSLEVVGLKDKKNQYPLQLSGGQQQRVAIARALVNNPNIIFADEPTGALDSHTSEEIMTLLKDLNKKHGKTIIMVTHDEELVKYATKVIRLKDGIILEEETTND